MVPDNLSGNWQLSLGATAMLAVDFSPQLASVAVIEQSDAASAKDAGSKQRTPRIIERVAINKGGFMPSFPFLPGRRRCSSRRETQCRVTTETARSRSRTASPRYRG